MSPTITTPKTQVLPDADLIKEYQKAHEQEFGQEINQVQAIEGLTRLLAFYKLALGFDNAGQVTKNAPMSTYNSKVHNDRH